MNSAGKCVTVQNQPHVLSKTKQSENSELRFCAEQQHYIYAIKTLQFSKWYTLHNRYESICIFKALHFYYDLYLHEGELISSHCFACLKLAYSYLLQPYERSACTDEQLIYK